MNGINYLIAKGGGYTPPAFDYARARQGVAALRGQEGVNALRQRILEREPERWEMEKAGHGLQGQILQIRELALSVKEEALKASGLNKPVEIPLPGGKWKVKGLPKAVAEVAQGMADFPNQINDPNFGPWAASKGVSLEEIKPTGWQPTTKGEKLGYEEELAGIKAKYQKEGKESPEEKRKAKRLEDLSKSFFSQIGRYYSAKRGVGQFIQDPNKEQVATEALESAKLIAQQYVEAGGDPRDLGLDVTGELGAGETSPYKTAEDVKAAYKAGTLTKGQAAKILREQFGFK